MPLRSKTGAAQGRIRIASLAFCAFVAALWTASIANAEVGPSAVQVTKIEGEVAKLRRRVATLKPGVGVDPAQRIKNGKTYLRIREPERAAIHFLDVVLHHQGHKTYREALYYLGEALYRIREFEGSRDATEAFLALRAPTVVGKQLRARAGVRLLKTAANTKRFSGVLDQVSGIRTSDPGVQGALDYYRGKIAYLVTLEESAASTAAQAGEPGVVVASSTSPQSFPSAEQFFRKVSKNSKYYAHAQYFLGVVRIHRGEISKARRFFEKVIAHPAKRPSTRRIRDLARLAVGRIHYEQGNAKKAVLAYNSVPRSSPYIDAALYEVAWAYVGLADAQNVESSLAELSIVAPNSPRVLEGRIMLGNLLLRLGRLRRAERVFQSARKRFAPVLKSLESVEVRHADLETYFATQAKLAIEGEDSARHVLPNSVRRWFPGDLDFLRTEALIGDLRIANTDMTTLAKFIAVARAAIQAPSRAKIFREFRVDSERITGLRNRSVKVRRDLLRLYERKIPSSQVNGLSQARHERKRFEQRVNRLPTTPLSFQNRNRWMNERYRDLYGQLRIVETNLLGMDARLEATQRFLEELRDPKKEADRAEIENTLFEQEQNIRRFRDEAHALRDRLDMERVQVGIGDFRYAKDTRTRAAYLDAARREVELLSGAGRMAAADLKYFQRIRVAERQLDATEKVMNQKLKTELSRIEAVLERESANLGTYRQTWQQEWASVGGLLGEVLATKFRKGVDNYRGLILRADLGGADISWTKREQQRIYLEVLTRERTTRLRAVEETYREALGAEDSEGGDK